MKSNKRRQELWDAVINGDLIKTQKVVSSGVDVNSRSELGVTAIMMGMNHPEKYMPNINKVVSYLISKGADVNSIDDNGDTALFYACRSNNVEGVVFLIENGADIDRVNKDGDKALDVLPGKMIYDVMTGRQSLCEAHQDIENKNFKKEFLDACLYGNLDGLFELLKSRPKEEIVPLFGDNEPLMCCNGVLPSHVEIIDLLVNHGFDINANNKENQNVFLLNITNGSFESLKKIMELGFDVLAIKSGNETMLDFIRKDKNRYVSSNEIYKKCEYVEMLYEQLSLEKTIETNKTQSQFVEF